MRAYREVRRISLGEHAAHRRAGPGEWVGGRVRLPVYITEDEPYRPEAVVWLELPSELVLGFSLIDPNAKAPSFSDTLRDVMRAPLAGPPRRPARIRVADETLAAAARAALGVTGTEVVVAPTPELDDVVQQFARSLPRADERQSYLEDGRVPVAAVERLLRAADVLWRVAPWKVANDGQVLRLDAPDEGIAGAAVSIIGALGESFGFLVFPSLAAYDAFAAAGERAMRRRRPPAKLDLGSSFLALNYYRAAELPKAMRREVAEHDWPVAGPDAYPRVEVRERDGVLRPLTADDVRLATACANALSAFVTRHREIFRGEDTVPVSESYEGEPTVRLTAPYEAFDLFSDEVIGPAGSMAASRDELFRGVGRNEPCPCGSGKKYKRCHLGQEIPGNAGSSRTTAPPETAAIHALDRRLVEAMTTYAMDTMHAERLGLEGIVSDPMTTAQFWLPWSLYHRRVRGRPLAEHFVADRGDRLTEAERAWVAAQSTSWLGIWEVEGAEPGAWLDLHDLLTGERRRVIEASASRSAARLTAVLGRVVDHGSVSVLCGVHPQPLPPLEAADLAREFRERLRRGRGEPLERLREERVGRDLIRRWEEECVALQERSRIPPQLRNRDGDELVFISERFDFDPAVRGEIDLRLAAMPAVVPPLDGEAEHNYIFHREDGATPPGMEDLIVGHAQVSERSLTLETNSARRANALRLRVEEALGDLIRYRRRRRRDAQRMVERAWERAGERDPGDRTAHGRARDEIAQTPEAQQMLREMKEGHYAAWPDQPLPALGGMTARQAVRTKAGRERVDALLKDIEFREAALPPGERFDVSDLRRALGL